MNNYILLGACLLVGLVLRRSGRLPDNAAASLNGFVVHISLPSLTLTYVHGLKLDTSLILPALMAWVMFGVGCGFFWLAARAFGLSRATTGGLMLTGGLASVDRAAGDVLGRRPVRPYPADFRDLRHRADTLSRRRSGDQAAVLGAFVGFVFLMDQPFKGQNGVSPDA